MYSRKSGLLKKVKSSAGRVAKKPVVWIVAAIVFLSAVFALIFKKRKTNEDQADKYSKDNRLRTIALAVAHSLRTSNDYNSWNPFSLNWWENDKKTYELLKDLTLSDFKIVERLYFNVYTNKRELRSDLMKHLNDEYLDKLNYLNASV